ncbi:MAG: hypothetical protein LBH85_08515 [Treponema sp.]|nr:hypothetical protein [Treponema sp.]
MALLKRNWEDHGRGPCCKLPAPLIRGIIDFLVASKEPDCGVSDEHKAPLARVSGAQIDRPLAPARKSLELRGISAIRAAGVSLRSMRRRRATFSGQFCKTLTGTSPYSGTEELRCGTEDGGIFPV